MIFKKTWLNVADNTNIKWMQTFHLYKGFKRRSTGLGFFVKGSARVVEPPRLVYKGFKFKFNKKGDICRGLIIRTAKSTVKLDGTTFTFQTNNAILIRKKQDLRSKYLFGPIPALVRRKKFKTLYKTIV